MNYENFKTHSYDRSGGVPFTRRPERNNSSYPEHGRNDPEPYQDDFPVANQFRRPVPYQESVRDDYASYRDEIPAIDQLRGPVQDIPHYTEPATDDYDVPVAGPFRRPVDYGEPIDDYPPSKGDLPVAAPRRRPRPYPEPSRDDYTHYRDDVPETASYRQPYPGPARDDYAPSRDMPVAAPRRRPGPYPQPARDDYAHYRDDVPQAFPPGRPGRYREPVRDDYAPAIGPRRRPVHFQPEDEEPYHMRMSGMYRSHYPEPGDDYDMVDDYEVADLMRRPVQYPLRPMRPGVNAPMYRKRVREDYDYYPPPMAYDMRDPYDEVPVPKMRRMMGPMPHRTEDVSIFDKIRRRMPRMGLLSREAPMGRFPRPLPTDIIPCGPQEIPESTVRYLKSAIRNVISRVKAGKGTLDEMPEKPFEVSFANFKKILTSFGIRLNKNKYYFIEDRKPNPPKIRKKASDVKPTDFDDEDYVPLIKEEKELEEGQTKTLLSPDLNLPLFVLIAHDSYPEVKLTSKEITDITNKLKELARKDRSFRDFSLESKTIDGVMVLRCNKRTQYNWLITSIPFAHKHAGIPLKSVESRHLKHTASFRTRMHAPEIPREKMCLLFNTQNEGLDTSNWKFTLQKLTDFTRVYTIEADEVSAELVKYWSSHLYYGTERIKVKRIPMEGKDNLTKDDAEKDENADVGDERSPKGRADSQEDENEKSSSEDKERDNEKSDNEEDQESEEDRDGKSTERNGGLPTDDSNEQLLGNLFQEDDKAEDPGKKEDNRSTEKPLENSSPENENSSDDEQQKNYYSSDNSSD